MAVLLFINGFSMASLSGFHDYKGSLVFTYGSNAFVFEVTWKLPKMIRYL